MKTIILFTSLLLTGMYVINCKPQETATEITNELAVAPAMSKQDSIRRG